MFPNVQAASIVALHTPNDLLDHLGRPGVLPAARNVLRRPNQVAQYLVGQVGDERLAEVLPQLRPELGVRLLDEGRALGEKAYVGERVAGGRLEVGDEPVLQVRGRGLVAGECERAGQLAVAGVQGSAGRSRNMFNRGWQVLR